MPFPRIMTPPEDCPLEGYEGFSIKILQNSSDAEWDDWIAGNLGLDGCEKCAAMQKTPRGKASKVAAAAAPKIYCPDCNEARTRFGRALVAFYGPGNADLDFSTSAAALATVERTDLPSEILMWLTMLPGVVRGRRREQLAKNLTGSLRPTVATSES